MKTSGNVIRIIAAVFTHGLLATTLWAQSNAVQFEYDARGRLVKVTSASGQDATFALDRAGNRLALETDIGAGEPIITSFMAPDVALYSAPTLGNHVTLTWSSEGTSGCDLSGTISGTQSHPANHAVTLQLTQDETFTLRCYLGGIEDVVIRSVDLMPATGAP